MRRRPQGRVTGHRGGDVRRVQRQPRMALRRGQSLHLVGTRELRGEALHGRQVPAAALRGGRRRRRLVGELLPGVSQGLGRHYLQLGVPL